MPDELTDAQRAALRDQLQHLIAELQASMDLQRESARPVVLDQTRVGRISRVDALQQQAMAAAGLRAAEARLQAAREALRRIQAGEYGWCQDCGESIGHARLVRQPEALRCLACQALLEKK
jgi:DnaK suppressor protein